MWLATKGGFLSAVEVQGGRRGRRGLVVRARERTALRHLAEYVEGGLEIEETPGRDYRYRAYLGREEFAEAVGAMALDIDYDNFKSAVGQEAKAGRVSRAYERALHDVWAVLGRLQPGGPYSRSSRRRRTRSKLPVFADDPLGYDADPLDPIFGEEAGR